ncbi:reverse transcriptase domain-containing protein, partial [Ralstonia solanacearum]|uniref:reverse transcriptase domain-containing protein n=1 Tax=Ralstonia solanacearum TaxID=305 RepID=UPI00399D772F
MRQLLQKTQVNSFSSAILGAPYATVQGILYPRPPYRSFELAKRSGGIRVIREPRKRLKLLQLKALEDLEQRAGRPKPCAHGFVKDRSIVTNARKHLERKPHFLLNLDLEKFFPSINFFRVRGVLKKPPFGFSHEVATVLAQMCVLDNELPQGAPTSPFLSNEICRGLDRDLMALARRHRATYTRYADDITFSFSTPNATSLPANICTFDGGLVTLGQELISIITSHSFQIHPTKTRMSTRRRRMEVTGVVINEFPNVKRVFIDRIRGALHAWDRYGYDLAQKAWANRVQAGASTAYEKRPWKRQTRSGNPPELKNVLWGKLLFVRMVRGADDAIYTRLAEKYNHLIQRERGTKPDFAASSLPVEAIVRNAEDAERAVFVVEWSGDYLPTGTTEATMAYGQGTAFAYKKKDRLITCDHVFTARCEIAGASVDVDIQSKDLREVSLEAHDPATGNRWPLRIVHRDAPRDLAILQFEGEPAAQRFFSGMDAPINRHAPGHLIGFPNWSPGRRANVEPAIVTNRFRRSALQRVEINQLIRKGNSGGPYVDELFRVAGVAQKGATQDDGNNECLCVAELDAWINASGEAPPPAASTASAGGGRAGEPLRRRPTR